MSFGTRTLVSDVNWNNTAQRINFTVLHVRSYWTKHLSSGHHDLSLFHSYLVPHLKKLLHESVGVSQGGVLTVARREGGKEGGREGVREGGRYGEGRWGGREGEREGGGEGGIIGWNSSDTRGSKLPRDQATTA